MGLELVLTEGACEKAPRILPPLDIDDERALEPGLGEDHETGVSWCRSTDPEGLGKPERLPIRGEVCKCRALPRLVGNGLGPEGVPFLVSKVPHSSGQRCYGVMLKAALVAVGRFEAEAVNV
jgi:hypothetical protein